MKTEFNLKQIILEKINRILNPNFEKKFISTLLFSGIVLLGYQRVLQLATSVEILSGEYYVKFSLNSGVDILFVIIGSSMILFSFVLFWTRSGDGKVKKYKSLASAAPDIRPLLDDNYRIFVNFGPNSNAGSTGSLRYDFEGWDHIKKEQIIPNNENIYGILEVIKHYKKNERLAVAKMKSHIQAFEAHVLNPSHSYSENQFPREFSDIIFSYCSEITKDDNNLDEYKEWLLNNISKFVPLPVNCYMFGSALYGAETIDVDVLIKTDNTNLLDIESESKRYDLMSVEFKKEFQIELHLVVFSELEKKSYVEFLNKLAAVKRII